MKLSGEIKSRMHALKTDLCALYYACRDPRTGTLPKLVILFALGYALSPVDIIPDFIPVIGHLDDVVIIPLLISLSIRIIPDDVWKDSRLKAVNEPVVLKKNRLFALSLLVTLLLAIAASIMLLCRHLS